MRNCGASIGNLETPFLWKGAIVCGQCHAKLSAPHIVNPAQTFNSLEDLARAAQSQQIPYAAPGCPSPISCRQVSFARPAAQGQLVRRKRFRMSAPVVAIGFILLIPSILGIIFFVGVGFLSGGAATQVSATNKQQARDELTQASVPEDEIETILNSQPLTQDQIQALTPDQKRATDDAAIKLSAGQVGAGFAGTLVGGTSLCMAVSFFVSGLLGWLLVMRKRVLQCQHCGAVVAAS